MDDYFREYIASDEPLNTKKKCLFQGCTILLLHGNKKILIKIDNTRPVHRSKDAGDVNAPSFSIFMGIKPAIFSIRGQHIHQLTPDETRRCTVNEKNMLLSYISFTPSSVPVCTSLTKISVEDIPAITEMYMT